MSSHLASEVMRLSAVADAQRALLRLRRPEDAQAVLTGLVERLGGEVVPAHVQGPDAIPVDLSLGAGDAVVATAPAGSDARASIERVLPDMVDLAGRMARVLEVGGYGRRLEELDLVTGLPRRGALLTIAEHAVAGADRLLGFAIDRPGLVEDAHGRARLDRLVATLATLVGEVVHPSDHLARLTGPGLGVLVFRADPMRLREMRDEVIRRWPSVRESDVEVLVAEEVVDEDPAVSLTRLEAQLELASNPVRAAETEPRRRVDH